MQALSERFELRLDQATLDRIDNWRGRQYDVPSRAQAVRRLVDAGLAADVPDRQDPKISDGERLIVAMLLDLMKNAKVKGEMNIGLIAEVLYGGHNWALAWEMSGLFHGHIDDPKIRSETVDILDMWDMLELSFDELSDADKKRIKEADVPHRSVKFLGFDGNGETEYLSIARFLVEQLGRFSRFKGRDFNSHIPMSVQTYRRMYEVYDQLRKSLIGRYLSADEILSILSAAVHPERRSRY